MKIELHLHTSRYSCCAVNTPEEMMQALVDANYDAVFITEHETVWGEAEIRQLQAQFPPIRIFPGVELTLGEEAAMHLLVLPTMDPEYIRLQHSPRLVLEKARKDGHLTVLTHPFRWPGGDGLLGSDLLPDAIELRTSNHSTEMGQLSLCAAEKYGLSLVNAGDIHDAKGVGHFWIETESPLVGAEDIRDVVIDGRYRTRMNP